MFEEQEQSAIDPDELSDEELRNIVAMPWSEQEWRMPFITSMSQASQADEDHAGDSTLSTALINTIFAQRSSEWV